jgi:hypothetical protein
MHVFLQALSLHIALPEWLYKPLSKLGARLLAELPCSNAYPTAAPAQVSVELPPGQQPFHKFARNIC